MIKYIATSAFAFFMPVVVLAQGDFDGLERFFVNVINFINSGLVPFIFAIAFLVFIWGVFNYFIFGGADEEKRERGKSLMLWGIIGFVVMVSVWGIVNIIADGLGLTEKQNEVDLPNAPINNR